MDHRGGRRLGRLAPWDFAFREAQLRDASVRVLCTWHVPWSACTGAPGLDTGLIITTLREGANQIAHQMAAEGGAKTEGVEVVRGGV